MYFLSETSWLVEVHRKLQSWYFSIIKKEKKAFKFLFSIQKTSGLGLAWCCEGWQQDRELPQQSEGSKQSWNRDQLLLQGQGGSKAKPAASVGEELAGLELV